ncbi:MAG: undecaprenyl-diphosphate phosphatase [Elusimicrobia bacterium]|nr:undecaprenyl-diphosphate phosphatase [Elusimicrobiota bacterium]
MGFFESTFLGLVQGLTEFLPVSSSGHLVIIQKLLSVGEQIEFDVFLHFATLLAVLIFFRNDILEIIKGILGKSEAGLKTLIGIIIGSAPTAVIGLLFNDFFEEKFSQPKTVAAMWIVTGFILWFSSMFSKSDTVDKNYSNTKITDFLLVGLFQGLAIMPGISRAGITISAALLLGFNRNWAFKYSMLLSIPAILGAGLLELKNFSVNTNILAGGIVAIISGILALYILSKIVIGKKFHYFSYYLWTVGIIGLLFL